MIFDGSMGYPKSAGDIFGSDPSNKEGSHVLLSRGKPLSIHQEATTIHHLSLSDLMKISVWN